MDTFETAIVAVITTLLASSGFWGFLVSRRDKRNVNTQLILGLAHDRIRHLSVTYIRRGYVTVDEYDDIIRYLYTPYKVAGGNGTIDHIIEELSKLPFYNLASDVPLEGPA